AADAVGELYAAHAGSRIESDESAGSVLAFDAIQDEGLAPDHVITAGEVDRLRRGGEMPAVRVAHGGRSETHALSDHLPGADLQGQPILQGGGLAGAGPVLQVGAEAAGAEQT